MTAPFVSIVINNYNYGDLLAEAIDSALAQTYPHVEVVVVDDGSTDDSRAVIARYGDRVRAVLQANGGQAAALSAGFAASRGDVVCLLDADDTSDPERAERVVDAFARWPRADWLRHPLRVVDAERRPIGPLVPALTRSGPVPPRPHRFVEALDVGLTSGLALRRPIGERVFPLPTRVDVDRATLSLVRDADAYLRCRLAAVGGWFASLDEPLGEYRRHSGQQFLGPEDLVRMLRRQNEVGRALPVAFGREPVARQTPTTVFKHEAVIAALEGAPLWSPRRLGAALRGWRRALRLLVVSPRLAVRQAAAIGFALLMPQRWADRVLRGQGFEPLP